MCFERRFVFEWSAQGGVDLGLSREIAGLGRGISGNQRRERDCLRVQRRVRVVVASEVHSPTRPGIGIHHLRVKCEVGDVICNRSLQRQSIDRLVLDMQGRYLQVCLQSGIL